MTARYLLIACGVATLLLGACKDTPKTDDPKKDSTASTTTPSGDPTVISSKVGRYAIKVPSNFGPAQEQQQPVQTQVGSVMMNMQLAQTADGNNAVMVAYCDYPEAIFNQLKVNKETAVNAMFDSARTGGLRNVQDSKLISEKKIELHGLPGRSIVFSGSSQGKPIHARFDYYIDVPRLYQVGYITTDSASVNSPAVAQMFSSLEVTPSPAAPSPDTTKK